MFVIVLFDNLTVLVAKAFQGLTVLPFVEVNLRKLILYMKIVTVIKLQSLPITGSHSSWRLPFSSSLSYF